MPETPYVCICKKCNGQFLSSKQSDKICKPCRLIDKGKFDYPRVFWKNKKIVLERDEFKCQCCGISQGELNTNKLIIHHIDGDRHNNSPSNLITLCNQCHMSLHKKYDKKILRHSNIYKLFANDVKFGEFGKNLIYGASKKIVKKQFGGKPKNFFGTKTPNQISHKS